MRRDQHHEHEHEAHSQSNLEATLPITLTRLASKFLLPLSIDFVSV